jgi:hypothetical protein
VRDRGESQQLCARNFLDDTVTSLLPNNRLERAGEAPAAQPARWADYSSPDRNGVTPAIRRLAVVVIVLLLFVAAPLAAEAQRAGTKRIGYLESSSPSPARLELLEAFRQGLRERGYLEGKDIAFESRFGEGKPDQIQRFAAELVGLKVDILVTSGHASDPGGKAGDPHDPQRHDTAGGSSGQRACREPQSPLVATSRG